METDTEEKMKLMKILDHNELFLDREYQEQFEAKKNLRIHGLPKE